MSSEPDSDNTFDIARISLRQVVAALWLNADRRGNDDGVFFYEVVPNTFPTKITSLCSRGINITVDTDPFTSESCLVDLTEYDRTSTRPGKEILLEVARCWRFPRK